MREKKLIAMFGKVLLNEPIFMYICTQFANFLSCLSTRQFVTLLFISLSHLIN